MLITVTLLAFIVLLLVGLATYTRIESAAAGNSQRTAQARQHALLGLDVALAQLQKNAGRDTTVTASAGAFSTVNSHWTGVWDAAPATATGATAQSWLVSGSEIPGARINPATSVTSTNAIELVGRNSTGTANNVVVAKQAVTSVGVPGNTTATPVTIGNYAWWVGDQGVKAPVGIGDTSSAVNYDPYSAELRSRIRQQISLGAGPASFEPRDTANAFLIRNLSATNQFAFLKNSAGLSLGLTPLQQNFHTWSPNNFNVLADTARGGLRQDLSLFSPAVPSPLGSTYDAWADYTSYMEDPAVGAGGAFPPSPPFSADPIRRRYMMQPGPPAIAPVLSYFLLSFNVRTQGGAAGLSPLEVRSFWKIGLWNPYSAALVPDAGLRIEVTGLPDLRVDNDSSGGVAAAFSLQSLYGGGAGNPLKIILPWDSTPPSGRSGADRLSWLPGRVYNWRSIEELTGTVPTDGYPSRFYSKSYTAAGESNGGAIRPVALGSVKGTDLCHVDGEAGTITVKLFAVRAGGDVELATFTSPHFVRFGTNSRQAQLSSTQFVYFFRLAEKTENPPWLQSPGVDPHQPNVAATAFAYGAGGDSPSAYPDDFEDSTFADRLLDRATDSLSYNEDVPVFELPRAPLLSLGMLQHLAIDGAQPFAVGNSWGAATPLNKIPSAQLFDRFFYSGLTAAVNPTTTGSSLVLPNPLLRVSPRQPNGTATTAADLKNAADARSSKFLLQGGAFNLNSTSAVAWAAVLRSVRFPAPASFTYLDADNATGTAASTGETAASVQSSDAQFFRFSQSAQETYKAEAGLSAGGSSSTPSPPNTHLFRQGMKTLTPTQVTALANAIAAAIKARQTTSGPFRSLEEFLNPSVPGGTSLLEDAIAAVPTINADAAGAPIEFSSQFLTQGDIMTALAPVLFARSDTFVIRSYGEAVNPTTAAVEGRAWCEAIVQRVPDYFDPAADPAETSPAALTSALNQTYGRRFKVISFRWLTRSDI